MIVTEEGIQTCLRGQRLKHDEPNSRIEDDAKEISASIAQWSNDESPRDWTDGGSDT
jgi:hypothetical protein